MTTVTTGRADSLHMRDIGVERHRKHLAAKNHQDDHDESPRPDEPGDVLCRDGRERSEEILIEGGGCLSRSQRGEHDATGDSAVEDKGQCEVSGGAALGAHELEHQCTKGSDDERGGHGGDPGEEGESDAGECHMSHAIAEQGEAALDEEDTDERGDEPDECRGDERSLHEVVSEHAHVSRPQARGRRVRSRA